MIETRKIKKLGILFTTLGDRDAVPLLERLCDLEPAHIFLAPCRVNTTDKGSNLCLSVNNSYCDSFLTSDLKNRHVSRLFLTHLQGMTGGIKNKRETCRFFKSDVRNASK